MGLARRASGLDVSPGRQVARCVRAVSLVGLASVISAGVLAAPAAAQPANDAPPSISGTPLQGQALTEVPGSWSDAKGVTVQWESCPDSSGDGCTPIPDSPTWAGSQYTPTTSEVGGWITVVETASDGRGNVSSAVADPVGPVTLDLVTSTMQWTFHYTPTYTSVMGLIITGLASQTTVLVGCSGHGCPFSRRVLAFKPPGTLNLARPFRGHRLRVGARITVAITIPGGIGKFYAFTVRHGLGPRIFIGCLAPGATRPGAAC
jgi:hypothetical protein